MTAPDAFNPLAAATIKEIIDELQRRSNGLFVVLLPKNGSHPTSRNVSTWYDGAYSMTLLGVVDLAQSDLREKLRAQASPEPQRDDPKRGGGR